MHTLSLVVFCLAGLGFGEEVMPEAEEAQKVLSNVLLAARAPVKRGAAPKKAAPKKAAFARKPAGKAASAAAALKKQKASSSGFDANELAGVTKPGKNLFGFTNVDPYDLGYFDPSGFTVGASENKVRVFREAELKHCRIAMLAALGFFVGEQFHPLFDGEIDGASVDALQKSLELSGQVWILPVVTVIFLEAISAVAIFRQSEDPGKTFGLSSDYTPGDVLSPLGITFDPLGLKPKDPEKLKEIQTKELNNGRAAMIGILGMFTQEAITHEPIFPLR
jgi:light-harvesting complex I chlorophyll a/b binding protein 1